MVEPNPSSACAIAALVGDRGQHVGRHRVPVPVPPVGEPQEVGQHRPHVRRVPALAPGEHGHPELRIELKYHEGLPVIREIKRVSKPGRRVYAGAREIAQVRQGLGVAIVSTPRGVMTDASARAANVGGEVLCTVF